MSRYPILGWTAEDDALIREKYPGCGTDIEELSGRYTAAQIRSRAYALNVKILDKSYLITSACRTCFNGVWYDTEKDAAIAAGRSESWIRSHRDKTTGVVTVLPSDSSVSSSVQLNVTVNGVVCKDCRQLADATGWKYTGKLAEAFSKCDLDSQFIVDRCQSLGVVPQSYVRLFEEFGDVIVVDRYIEEHPLAFQNGRLLSCWKSVKPGGCSASVIINGKRIVSGSGLAAALGVSKGGRYAEFLRDATVNHQELVNESIKTGVSLLDLWLGRRESSSWSRWTEDELAILWTSSLSDIPDVPGRTRQAVLAMMSKLGITRGMRVRVSDANVIKACKESNDYFYVRCKICGKAYLLEKKVAVGFTHDMCQNMVAVPDGWSLPYNLDH